jgi:hypothetical protein
MGPQDFLCCLKRALVDVLSQSDRNITGARAWNQPRLNEDAFAGVDAAVDTARLDRTGYGT